MAWGTELADAAATLNPVTSFLLAMLVAVPLLVLAIRLHEEN